MFGKWSSTYRVPKIIICMASGDSLLGRAVRIYAQAMAAMTVKILLTVLFLKISHNAACKASDKFNICK